MPAHIQHTTNCNLVADLVAQITRVRHRDKFGQITIIVPNFYSSYFLHRALASHMLNLFNVRFLTTPEFVAQLLPAGNNQRTLDTYQKLELVRRAAMDIKVPNWHRHRNNRNLHRALYNTFQELEALSDAELEPLRNYSESAKAIWQAILHYRRQLQDTGTSYARAETAAELFKANPQRVERLFGKVMALAVTQTTANELPIWDAITSGYETTILCVVTGDLEGDTALCHVHQAVPHEVKNPIVNHQVPSNVYAAFSVADEMRQVVRNIVAQARQGVPLDCIAVVYASPAYAERAEQSLSAANIPTYAPFAKPFRKNSMARFALCALELFEDQHQTDLQSNTEGTVNMAAFSLGKFSNALYSAPLLNPATGKRIPVEAWAKQARDALYNAGSREWQRLENTSPDGEGVALWEFVATLTDNLQSPTRPTFAAWTDWLWALLEKYLPKPLLANVRMRQLLERIAAIDKAVALIDGIKTVSFAVFKQTFSDAVDHSYDEEISQIAGRVFVAPIATIVACNFRAVHILGMVDNFYPANITPSPLLGDELRNMLMPKANTLQTAFRKHAAERLEFLSVLQMAEFRCLYWPAYSSDSSNKKPPANWFIEGVGQASGKHNLSGSEVMKMSVPEIKPIDLVPQLAEIQLATSPEERGIALACAWRSRGNEANTHYAALSSVLSQGLRALTDRANKKEFTRHDGYAPPRSNNQQKERPYSPTQLEEYAICPFRFFLKRVLRINEPQDALMQLGIANTDKGELIHKILEHAVIQIIAQKGKQLDLVTWQENLRRIAEQKFTTAERTSFVGLPEMWRLERERIIYALDMWLEYTFEHFKTWRPIATEKSFGYGQSETEVIQFSLANGKQITLRGKIDRIDTTAEGTKLMAIDYKTGKVPSASKGKSTEQGGALQQGEALQLPLYAHGIKQVYSTDKLVKAMYWGVNLDNPGPGTPIDLEALDDELKATVSVLIDGIAGGKFPANPGKSGKNCHSCSYKLACPKSSQSREKNWNNKNNTDALRSYRILKQGASNG